MKRNLFFTTVLLITCMRAFCITPETKGSIEYRVSMPEPHTHYFEVEILLRGYEEDHVDFKLPVWTPGSYLVREYAKNAEGFTATVGEDEKNVDFKKLNKNTWRVSSDKAELLTVRYRVYAFDGSVRMSYLDDSHAFIMANTLLMYVESLKKTSSILKIDLPPQWKKISTTLTRLEGTENAFYVPDYDILVDSPIEIGNHDVIEFTASGVPHEVVMYGAEGYNAEQIRRDLTKIVEQSTAVYGENPNEKYIFFVHHSDRGAGGLEHANATVIGVSRKTYTDQKLYDYFLSLAAHEYFHLYMVKRLKPAELEELNYDEENYTDLLWMMEGITSYYEEKIMYRAGFYDEKTFLENLLSAMEKVQNTSGAGVQTVADAGFDAWIKYYRRDANSDNSQISYYTKGTVLGVLLDLAIINGSGGEHSLDEVINQLYVRFYKKKGKGITTDDFKQAAEKAGKINLDSFFADYIFGTNDLDNEKYLEYAGIKLVELNKDANRKTVGLTYKKETNGIFVSFVKKDGPAYDNGIYVGDELLAVDGQRIKGNNLSSLINEFKAGDTVVFLVNRKGLIKTILVDIRKSEEVRYTFEKMSDLTKIQEKVLKTWLGKSEDLPK